MSGYLGIEPVPQVYKVRHAGVIGSDTSVISVPGGFSSGNIEVYINGLYVQPTDYDDSDGANVDFSPTTLTTGTEYIIMTVVSFTVAGTYNKAEADGKYAQLIGGASANFSIMPQVGGDPIVESGSNSDGEWTRWADGSQRSLNVITSNSSSPYTWNYPLIFSSNPQVLLTCVAGNPRIFHTSARGSTSVDIETYDANSTQVSVLVDVVAFGRWF